ncbi:MAG: VF530 family DNA-binding protein [Candidatus Gracilibacteria bacterium]|nr:VF530 family DNA-binding protein [Candidatus Gracilibacteria bacterium]
MEDANNMNHEILHGVSLSMIMDYLIKEYGFDELAQLIRINCFKSNPSKESSLKFLRKTEWARLQVQGLYVRTIKERQRN